MRPSRPRLPGSRFALTLAAALSAGCVGSSGSGGSSTSTTPAEASCGVGPVLDQDGGVAHVNDAGVVTFDVVSVGTEVDFQVAVRDSADVDETITGATLTGTGASAFQVMSSFPIAVPAKQPVLVDIRFAPQALGAYSAQLILETAKMGPSPVSLQGTGGE